jgi:hypothetical protein
MRLLRLLVATLCLASLGLTAAPAHAAGTLSFSPLQWQGRPSDRLSNVLNREDCLADRVATTTLSIRGIPSGKFEVWVGSGCDNSTNRVATSTTRTCARVVGDKNPIDQSLTIHFRDLIKPYGMDDEATDESVCNTTQTAGLLTRTLYFVVYDPTTNASLLTTSPSWAFKYDIQAPPPPGNVTARSGDETIVTNFTAPANETNLIKYHFYCSPKSDAPAAAAGTAGTNTGGTAGTDAGGSAGTETGGTAGSDPRGTAGTDAAAGADTGGTAGTDTGGTAGTDTGGTAGTAGSAGTAGTTTVDPNCQSAVLIPGQPVPDGAVECGTVPSTGASGGETDPVLTNGDEFAIAVATEDAVNNIGVLSNLACAVPKDVRGFYENYRDAGGTAGGGYCTFAPAKHGALASLLAFGVGALALLRRRK